MPKTQPIAEPTERPYLVALSRAEIEALIKFHTSIARKLPAKVGSAVMGKDFMLNSFQPARTRDLFRAARELLAAHCARAKELLSIIK